MSRTIMVGITLILAALMAACAAAAQDLPLAQGAALSGIGWMLASLNGNALIEGKAITLRFGETSIEGSGGCNTYAGSYTASEDSLSVSGVYATEMACIEPQGIMAQEQAYFQALNATAGYRVAQDQGSGDRLELYDEAGTQIMAFIASTSAALAGAETPTSATPEFLLDCTLEMDETYPVGEPVSLRFALHNPTDRPLYVLTWYTPLEGMTGEILRVTRDGQELPYQGVLAKRGDPTRQEYVVIEPGEATSAQVDLRAGYDLSTRGSYQIQFTTGLQDVTDDGSLLPRKRDDHRPQSLSCNTVGFSIVQAPEPPTATPVAAATPTAVPPTATPTPEPLEGFRRYVNGASGVSLWVPESWTIIEPGPHAPILQSYPQDKYVGGEGRKPGDTKCDLYIHPPGIQVADVVPQNRSDPPVTVVSEQEVVLHSGRTGKRFEVDSLGRFLSLVTEVNERAVTLACFGELAPFDEIAVTLGAADIVPSTPLPAVEPAAALKQYRDEATGASVLVPGDWVVTGIVPGQRATLQSYPENKYTGGEALQSGDTKCDLSIRPPDISAVDFVHQIKSNSAVTIVSEDEITLQSGEPGTKIELESMGRSLILVTEVDKRVVVLTCFGDFAPFDEIADTLDGNE